MTTTSTLASAAVPLMPSDEGRMPRASVAGVAGLLRARVLPPAG